MFSRIQELEEATAEKNKLSQSLEQKLHKILNLEMRLLTREVVLVQLFQKR